MLKRSGESKHHYLFLILEEKLSVFHLWVWCLLWGFLPPFLPSSFPPSLPPSPGLSCGTRDLHCCMFLVVACGLLSCCMRTLSCGMHVGSSSSTRDRTWAPCTGSMESYPLDHQGSPKWVFHIWLLLCWDIFLLFLLYWVFLSWKGIEFCWMLFLNQLR